MRKAIFKNHEITESRAKAAAEAAKKVEDEIKEKVEYFTEIKDVYNTKLDEINKGFMTRLKQIEDQERRKYALRKPKLLSTEARAMRRRKMKQA